MFSTQMRARLRASCFQLRSMVVIVIRAYACSLVFSLGFFLPDQYQRNRFRRGVIADSPVSQGNRAA
jgi:hypothetical protein